MDFEEAFDNVSELLNKNDGIVLVHVDMYQTHYLEFVNKGKKVQLDNHYSKLINKLSKEFVDEKKLFYLPAFNGVRDLDNLGWIKLNSPWGFSEDRIKIASEIGKEISDISLLFGGAHYRNCVPKAVRNMCCESIIPPDLVEISPNYVPANRYLVSNNAPKFKRGTLCLPLTDYLCI